jgi:hypothetical protein
VKGSWSIVVNVRVKEVEMKGGNKISQRQYGQFFEKWFSMAIIQ